VNLNGYDGFFAATAGASGALIGLLFVAISVSHRTILGPDATVTNKVRASTALTSFITPLTICLLALIPDIGVRITSIIAGVIGLIYAASAIRLLLTGATERTSHWRALSALIGFIGVMVTDLTCGILLEINSHLETPNAIIAVTMVSLLGIGIDRAWELVGGRRASVTTSVKDLFRGSVKSAPEPRSGAGTGTDD
jgi:hypothetical protein